MTAAGQTSFAFIEPPERLIIPRQILNILIYCNWLLMNYKYIDGCWWEPRPFGYFWMLDFFWKAFGIRMVTFLGGQKADEHWSGGYFSDLFFILGVFLDLSFLDLGLFGFFFNGSSPFIIWNKKGHTLGESEICRKFRYFQFWDFGGSFLYFRFF